jgi:hypothetical protein
MKMMCIDDNFITKDGFEPKFGEIVTATQTREPEFYDCYDLLEYPLDSEGNEICFDKKHFAPLSDIDETELIKERELVNA